MSTSCFQANLATDDEKQLETTNFKQLQLFMPVISWTALSYLQRGRALPSISWCPDGISSAGYTKKTCQLNPSANESSHIIFQF